MGLALSPGRGAGWTIRGNYKDFTNPVKLLVGGTVDTETVGLAAGLFWHALWGGLGFAWIGWFMIRPMFLIRARVLAQEGGDALLNDPVDRVVAFGIIAGCFILIAIGFFTTDFSTLIPSLSRLVNQRSKRLI